MEVPFAYVEYIHTKPYKRLFKSTNPEYKRLIVVDKEMEERRLMQLMLD